MASELNGFPLILLAGGNSSRMGSIPKGLLEVDGRPWLAHQCENFRRNSGLGQDAQIVLVLGYHADEYTKITASIPGIISVMNPEPEHGPFSSIQAGLRKVLEPDFEKGFGPVMGAFILPIDVPVPSRGVWISLSQALSNGVRVVQPVTRKRGETHGGHPVLLSASEMRVILELKSSDRLDRHLHSMERDKLKRLEVSDPTIQVNLNSPEDWADYFGRRGDTELIGQSAAILSLVEVGLGSVLHAFHVPTSGHWLSLNQSFWLSRLTRQARRDRTAPLTVSNITATLKSLSPAGKKLTPMLAISAQGALFNTGTVLFGPNLLGAAVGAAISSTWAFIQPVLIYYIIFGNSLIEAGAKLLQRCQEVFQFSDDQALRAVILILSIKALMGVLVAGLAWALPQSKVDQYRDRLLSIAKRAPKQTQTISSDAGVSGAARGAARDLFQPLFFISLGLTFVFFYWAESSKVALIWALIRPLAVGFILFFLIRILPTENILLKMENYGFRRFSSAIRIAKSFLTREHR